MQKGQERAPKTSIMLIHTQAHLLCIFNARIFCLLYKTLLEIMNLDPYILKR